MDEWFINLTGTLQFAEGGERAILRFSLGRLTEALELGAPVGDDDEPLDRAAVEEAQARLTALMMNSPANLEIVKEIY